MTQAETRVIETEGLQKWNIELEKGEKNKCLMWFRGESINVILFNL